MKCRREGCEAERYVIQHFDRLAPDKKTAITHPFEFVECFEHFNELLRKWFEENAWARPLISPSSTST